MHEVTAPDELPATSAHERRLIQLGQQAASIAHGLNNLLAAVVDQSAQLLAAAADGAVGRPPEGAVLDAATADALRLIHQAALDGAGLTRRLLQQARDETVASDGSDASDSRDPAILDPLDLRRVLADAVELTRSRWQDAANRQGAAIAVTLDAPLPLPIRGAPADLREAVVNLILNAVDALPAGGQLLLRGHLQDGTVSLTCEDNGIGMPPAVQARLFEPFFTTKGRQGNGLGLAIVQRVVRQHGGTIQVTSAPGRGTAITIRLPAAQPRTALASRAPDASAPSTVTISRRLSATPLLLPSAEAPILTDTPAARALAAAHDLAADELAATLAPLSLLVVDDDPVFRGVFMRRLALDARCVQAVGDAEAALSALEAGDWAVVCLDDGLPDVSGRELAAEIRRRGLACSVILVTGAATSPDDPGLISPGVDAVLPKPCTDAELARALQTAQPNPV